MTLIKTTKRLSDNAVIVRQESVAGSSAPDQIISSLPNGASVARKGIRNQILYKPEPKGHNDIAQFGTGKYYSPKFRLGIAHLGALSVTERVAAGINGFNGWDVMPQYKSQVGPGQGFLYSTENFLGPLQGPRFHLTSLQDFVNLAASVVPRLGYGDLANCDTWVMDIESSVYLDPGDATDQYPGFGSGYFGGQWGNWKNNQLKMESNSETLRVEDLANRGRPSWDFEMHVRRANRLSILLYLCKLFSKPGTLVSQGFSMYQGFPDLNISNTDGIFVPGNCQVNNIGGDNDGYITLNVPSVGDHTFRLHGDVHFSEDILWGYWYRGTWTMSLQDEDEIWNQHKPGTQTYPYIWSKMNPEHVMAAEKGYMQLNRRRMQQRQGRTYSFWRMIGIRYEFEYSYNYNVPRRCPLPEVQNQIRYNNPNIRDTPGTWLSPYITYAVVAVTRFYCGDDLDCGVYVFPEEPADNDKDKSQIGYYGFDMHPISAMVQARADYQFLETFYPGSTLVEDPEVQTNATGPFETYDAALAYGYSGGQQGARKPCAMARYKTEEGGTRVVIQMGTYQGYTAESTHVVRLGAVGNNMFRIKLRGPGVHLFEFKVPNGDSNQTYSAEPLANGNLEMPAYSGRVQPVNS